MKAIACRIGPKPLAVGVVAAKRSPDGDVKALARLHDLAHQRGFTLLSAAWEGSGTNYRFRCAQGHVFERRSDKLHTGKTRCAACAQATHTRRSDERALARLRDVADQLGFTLLSTTWEGAGVIYQFRCPQGHVFGCRNATLRANKAPCAACAQASHRQRFLDVLVSRGYVRLETGSLDPDAPPQLMCPRGHVWAMPAGHTLSGSHCRVCAQQRPDGLAYLQQLAAAHQGHCLAEAYQGMNVKYLWRCAHGHQWRARGSAISAGGWCRRCRWVSRGASMRRQRAGLARLQAMAASHGGICLSEAYTVGSAAYRFQCAQGHVWQTTGHTILHGSWCRRCVDAKRPKGTLEQMQTLAAQRGGHCLSDTFVNSSTKLRWQCQLGHVWDTTPASIVKGHWCPECGYLTVAKKMRARGLWGAPAEDICVTESLDAPSTQ